MLVRVAAVLVPVVLIVAVIAFRWGIADFYASNAYKIMDGWNKKSPVTLETWEEAFVDLTEAVSWDPTHPDYRQRLSRLYRIQLTENHVADSEREEVGRQAKHHMLLSLGYRPRWGQAWAEYALLKSVLDETDAEMADAFVQAAKWGPWEPNVLRIVTAVGLYRYDLVSEHVQQDIIGTVVRGLRSGARGVFPEVFSILEYYPPRKQIVAQELYPFLAEMQHGKFYRLADWSWLWLDKDQKNEIVLVTIQRLGLEKNPPRIIRNAKNGNFRLRICTGMPRTGTIKKVCRLELER